MDEIILLGGPVAWAGWLFFLCLYPTPLSASKLPWLQVSFGFIFSSSLLPPRLFRLPLLLRRSIILIFFLQPFFTLPLSPNKPLALLSPPGHHLWWDVLPRRVRLIELSDQDAFSLPLQVHVPAFSAGASHVSCPPRCSPLSPPASTRCLRVLMPRCKPPLPFLLP